VAPWVLIISIMHHSPLSIWFILAVLGCSAPANSAKAEEANEASSRGVICELNLARQNPALYATFVEELRGRMNGNVLVLPGGTRLRTKEGTAALDEAIRFLRTARPQAPLVTSPGMCRAAADHCADQASGGFGHAGRDASNAFARISRYGTCDGGWGENISYGKSTARAVVLALIIDDGLPGRKHRKNIFNPTFGFAGAAFGRHARFGTICSMDFAGGYAERGQSQAVAAIARNF
jgi:uncharacterized protein YkwD